MVRIRLDHAVPKHRTALLPLHRVGQDRREQSAPTRSGTGSEGSQVRDTASKRIGYRQIADQLRTRVEAGTYPPDDALPSEALLKTEFSVARDTVRRALDQLEAEGVINTVHGRGRFVTKTAGGPPVGTKHEHVADSLRQRIQSGTLKPGAALPTEAEICTQFDVSRTTARKAFAELERDGLARSEKGHPRVVTTPPDFHDTGDRSTAWIVHGETPI